MSQYSLSRLDAFISDLKQQIVDLEQQIKFAQQVRDLFRTNPIAAGRILDLLTAPHHGGHAEGALKQAAVGVVGASDKLSFSEKVTVSVIPGTTARNFERIAGYLRASKNEWSTTADIQNGTELSRNEVIHILYKTHRSRFHRRRSPENQRIAEWRLAEGEPEPPSDAEEGPEQELEQEEGQELSQGKEQILF